MNQREASRPDPWRESPFLARSFRELPLTVCIFFFSPDKTRDKRCFPKVRPDHVSSPNVWTIDRKNPHIRCSSLPPLPDLPPRTVLGRRRIDHTAAVMVFCTSITRVASQKGYLLEMWWRRTFLWFFPVCIVHPRISHPDSGIYTCDFSCYAESRKVVVVNWKKSEFL